MQTYWQCRTSNNRNNILLFLFFFSSIWAVIASRVPAGTSVPTKDFLGAREDFLQIL
jgi:hypothetical protein